MKYYDKIADGYNELHGKEQEKKLEIIKRNLKVKGLILDIGSGTGISLKYFDNVIQVDPSLNLLKKSSGFRVLGCGESLPFKDHVFDAVISVTALHHCDIDKTIKEIKRVSKKNAKFAFTILKRAKNFDEIRKKLHDNFKLKEIEEEKDLILISF